MIPRPKPLASGTLSVEFYALLGWVGIWVGSLLMLIAMLDLSAYICLCTRFLHDIYAVFVCTIYLSDGLIGIHQRFGLSDWAEAWFALSLGVLVILLATALSHVPRTKVLSRRIRQAVADYSLAIAVLAAIGLSYRGEVGVDRLALPRHYAPTYAVNRTTVDGDGGAPADAEMVPRDWVPGLAGPGSLPFVALLASIPIVALFFFDQLFSCILGQKEELGIKKGEYYHSSFFLIGVFNLIFPLFGLPFVTASLPHSPQFVKALSDFSPETGRVTKVHESRVAPFLVYLLCFLALLWPQSLETVPEGVINGILACVAAGRLLWGRVQVAGVVSSGVVSAGCGAAVFCLRVRACVRACRRVGGRAGGRAGASLCFFSAAAHLP